MGDYFNISEKNTKELPLQWYTTYDYAYDYTYDNAILLMNGILLMTLFNFFYIVKTVLTLFWKWMRSSKKG